MTESDEKPQDANPDEQEGLSNEPLDSEEIPRTEENADRTDTTHPEELEQEQWADQTELGEQPESPEEQQEEFQCTIQVQDSGPWKKKVSIEIPRSEVNKELDRQFGELRWNAEVPGFRKGRAPRRLIEKRYGRDMTEQAKLRLMARAFEKVEERQDFEVLGEADLDLEKVELPAEGDFHLEYEVEVKPEFDLPPLEGIRIEKPIFEVTPERVEKALMDLRIKFGHIEDVSADAVRENDKVHADVVLKVEGLEVEERAKDLSIRVVSTMVLGVRVEDMGQVLAGAKAGETRTARVEIDDTHHREDYRGKTAEITMEVTRIERFFPAEIDDVFLNRLGVADETELKKILEDELEQQADKEIRQMMAAQVYAYLDKMITFDLPEGLAARYADRLLARRYYELLERGVPQERIEENLQTLQSATGEQANRQLKMTFIMDKVADKLAVTVGEAEINGVVAQIAARQGRRPERLREDLHREGRLEALAIQIRDNRAVDRLLEMAEVVDAPLKEAESQEAEESDKD